MNDVFSFVKKEYDRNKIDSSHDFIHAYNVYNLTCSILDSDYNEENEDFKIIAKCSALTHDLCDEKYFNKIEEASRIQIIIGEIFSEHISASVFEIITNLSFSNRIKFGNPKLNKTSLEIYLIVSDADMLESMGLIGFLRTFMFPAVHSSKTSDAYNYVIQKLTCCNEYLHSPFAKKEGQVRHDTMLQLINIYANERTFL